jgi:hypothetical protein
MSYQFEKALISWYQTFTDESLAKVETFKELCEPETILNLLRALNCFIFQNANINLDYNHEKQLLYIFSLIR